MLQMFVEISPGEEEITSPDLVGRERPTIEGNFNGLVHPADIQKKMDQDVLTSINLGFTSTFSSSSCCLLDTLFCKVCSRRILLCKKAAAIQP